MKPNSSGGDAAALAEAPTPIHLPKVSGRPGQSLVQQTTEALRRAVLGAPRPGVFLGSEEALIEALGVSRPTFRQAAKVLRHENLLTIKRGMGGGFFSRSPSIDAVSRMAAIFLNAQDTSMRHIYDVVAPLQTEAARLVALNPDIGVRGRLLEFIEKHREHEQASGVAPQSSAHLRRMMEFERLLVDLAGNPAIALVMNVMLDLVRDARRVNAMQTAERIAAYDQYQTRLAQAVLEGDPAMAALICQRHLQEIRRWVPDEPVQLAPAGAEYKNNVGLQP